MNILHLSHTDINSDSRILKEMQSIAKYKDSYKLHGIGVFAKDAGATSSHQELLKISGIHLFSRKLTWLPKVVRHFCSLIELTCKMLFLAVKVKPRIIHCHDTLVLPLGVMLKIICGAKLIYDAHELESNRNGLSKFLSHVTLFLEKSLWRFVDRLIVVSPSIRAWYNQNVGSKPTSVILNSPIYKEQQIDKSSDYFRDKFNIPSDALIFLYLGAVCKGRGIDLSLNVFKELGSDFHVIFMGYGDMSTKVQNTSMNFPNIHFHEAVPHEQVVAIAQSADVGLCLIENVSLSDYFCLPNKLFEYAFANIPVMTSDFPDISMLTNKHKLGICTNLDSESIKYAILDFKSFLNDYKPLSLHELSWKAQEIKLNQLYCELANTLRD